MTLDLETRRLFEDVLGCKWTLGILDQLGSGTVRPGRLRRALPGLTTKVMQQRLKKLERFGLATRFVVAEKPLHVEYRLTAKGRQLSRIVDRVRRYSTAWGSNAAAGRASRPR
jgi:DNA-binding HxlR family transcriptional regulator